MDYSKINEAIDVAIKNYQRTGFMIANDMNEVFKEVGIDRIVKSHEDNPVHAVAAVHLRVIQLMIKDAE